MSERAKDEAVKGPEEERRRKNRQRLLYNIQKYRENRRKTKEMRRSQAKVNFNKKKIQRSEPTGPIGIAAQSDRERRKTIPTKISNSFVNFYIKQEVLDHSFINEIKVQQTNDSGIKANSFDDELLLTIASLVTNDMPTIDISSAIQYFLKNSREGSEEDFKRAIDNLVRDGKLYKKGRSVSLYSIK
jgi:hypothetical protein